MSDISDHRALPQILLARQPILDKQLKLFAYELLFRGAEADAARFLNGDQATSQVVLNAVTGISPETAEPEVRAFVNMTESMLLTGRAPPVPPGWVVLEVLETVAPTADIIKNLTALKLFGYQLALDDFVFSESWDEILRMVDYVKLDVRAHSPDGLREQVQLLQPYKLCLLAEKIETHEEMEFCKQLGFELFQGYFLERPQIVRGKKISANLQLVMTLLSTLQREDAKANEIVALVSQDPRLSYQLLRIINSAAFARPRPVQSVREAVMLLGLRSLRNWIALIAMANAHGKPPELITTLLVRARCCDNMARSRTGCDADAAFTVGLFSGLDALLDTDLVTLLTQMPLSDEVKSALLHRDGTLGELLNNVLDYEHGNWHALDEAEVDLNAFQHAYMESLIWARATQAVMN